MGWGIEGVIMKGMLMKIVIIMLVVVRLIRRKLIGDFMDLFSVIVRIISVFFIRLINISIEKNIVKLVCIFFFGFFLKNRKDVMSFCYKSFR